MIILPESKPKGVNTLLRWRQSLLGYMGEGQRDSKDPICRISNAATGRLAAVRKHDAEQKEIQTRAA